MNEAIIFRYLSFEFAHIVFLFVGINFVLESFLLVALIEGRNKQLLRHDNSSSEQLLLDYLDLQRRGGIMKFLFDYGLVSIPVPELREKIEYKIIQEYFVRSYNLPAEFKFANYLCILLKTFVFSLLEVRPISWLIVAMLAVLNFLRVIVIDPIYQSHVCEKYHTHFHIQPSSYYGKCLFGRFKPIPDFTFLHFVYNFRSSCVSGIHFTLLLHMQYVSLHLPNLRIRSLGGSLLVVDIQSNVLFHFCV